MKKISALLLLYLSGGLQSFAQEIVNDATLNYAVSIVNTNDSILNKYIYKVFLKGNLSRSEFENHLGKETTIFDSKEKKGVILKEYSNQKLMIVMNESDWEEKNSTFSQMKFKIEEGLVSINGYECKRAICSSLSKESTIIFFSPSIVLFNKDYNNSFSSLSGLPVKYERKLSNGITYVYTLESINYDIVSSNKFEIPKSNYRILTYEEVKKIEKERKE